MRTEVDSTTRTAVGTNYLSMLVTLEYRERERERVYVRVYVCVYV